MNQTDVMLRIIELAGAGGALEPEDAIAKIAALIDRLDAKSLRYEEDILALLAIGATLWELS